MSEFSNRVAQRLPRGWIGKMIWIVLGIGVFWLAYLVGDYFSPIVAAFVQLITAIFHVFTNPPRLPLP